LVTIFAAYEPSAAPPSEVRVTLNGDWIFQPNWVPSFREVSKDAERRQVLGMPLGSGGSGVVAGRSTTKDRVAGVGSVFPAPSVARTATVWLPSARFEYDLGLEQDENAPPSSWHWKVERSEAVKEKLTDAEVTVPAGPSVIVVSGGVRSGARFQAGLASATALAARTTRRIAAEHASSSGWMRDAMEVDDMAGSP
jgi:hypothetical protein